MAKGKRARGRKTNGYSGNKGDSVVLRGHIGMRVDTAADPAGGAAQRLHPALISGTIVSQRLIELCKLYQLYRFRRLSFHFLAGGTQANPSVANSSMIVSVVPTEAVPGLPLNAFEMLEMDHVAWNFNNQTIPTCLRLPPHVLKGEKNYYSTQNVLDAPCIGFFACVDNQFLAVAGRASGVWDWEIEFYGRTPDTVLLKQLKEQSTKTDAETPPVPAGWKVVKS